MKEVGEVIEIGKNDIKYLYHKSGNPVEEARMIKDLLDRGMDQYEIATLLGVSQPNISKKLSLLTIEPELLRRAEQEEIPWTVLYKLSKLPQEEQRKFIDKESITLKEVKQALKQAKTIEMVEFVSQPVSDVSEKIEKWSKQLSIIIESNNLNIDDVLKALSREVDNIVKKHRKT
jgi:ParB-like chromosome segregation protein Spo0J